MQDPTIDVKQAVKDSIAQFEADTAAKDKPPASEQTASRESHLKNDSGSSSSEHIVRYTNHM